VTSGYGGHDPQRWQPGWQAPAQAARPPYGQPPGPPGSGISRRVIFWSVAAVIFAIAVATTVIVVALRPTIYKVEFRAHWEDASEPLLTYGLDGENQQHDPNCTGGCLDTQKLQFKDNGTPRSVSMTVSSSTASARSGSTVVDCTIFVNGKQVAYQRGSGTVSCSAMVGQ
jgi:hypothetical protein